MRNTKQCKHLVPHCNKYIHEKPKGDSPSAQCLFYIETAESEKEQQQYRVATESSLEGVEARFDIVYYKIIHHFVGNKM